MELWLLSISVWPIPHRSVFGSRDTIAATYTLISKVLLKFHADLLRFLFLFHGLFVLFHSVFFFLSQRGLCNEFTWSIGQLRAGSGCFEESLENSSKNAWE